MLRSQEELEQMLEQDRQQAMEMLENGKTSAKVLWSSAKQGIFGMGTAKFNEIKKWSAEENAILGELEVELNMDSTILTEEKAEEAEQDRKSTRLNSSHRL